MVENLRKMYKLNKRFAYFSNEMNDLLKIYYILYGIQKLVYWAGSSKSEQKELSISLCYES